MKIHFVGASGVGKSVLAQFAACKTGYNILPSPSRTVITSQTTKDAAARMFRDLDAADHVQRLIWQQMLTSEAEEAAASGSFISERSIDVIAYTADQSRVCGEIVSSGEFKRYMEDFRSGERLVFFVRPEPKVVQKAADGVRDPWLSWECVNRIDGMLQLLLAMHDVPYVPVRGDVLLDRFRLVESQLIAWQAAARTAEKGP